MTTGKIKFYSTKKGFGFITGDDCEEYFFHICKFPKDINPVAGMPVEFTPVNTNRGLSADNIEIFRD